VVKGRYGWLLLLLVVLSWDVASAITNGESLTFTFRRAVAETAWRWPIGIAIAVLVIHLFLPPRLQKYDPLDRLYQRLAPDVPSQPRHPQHEPPTDPQLQPDGSEPRADSTGAGDPRSDTAH
jgi:hypothetical protein